MNEYIGTTYQRIIPNNRRNTTTDIGTQLSITVIGIKCTFLLIPGCCKIDKKGIQ